MALPGKYIKNMYVLQFNTGMYVLKRVHKLEK